MILQTELTALDSEIASLQALIEAKRQQQEILTSAESLASEALSRLTQAVSRIGDVAPGAIASLKTAVLTLFADGDGGNDGGGNQPAAPDDPTPRAEQPQNFTPGSTIVDEVGSYGIVIGTNNIGMGVDWLDLGNCPNPASGKGIWYNWAKDNHAIASLKRAAHDQVKLFSTEEFLQFQGWESDQLDELWDGEWVSDKACEYRWGGATINRWIVVFAQSCEWASPFASHLACLLWEDAPLLGQHCSVSLKQNENKDTSSEGEDMPKPPSTEMVHLSAQCGYLKLQCNGQILSAYCWFAKKAIAQSWLKFLEPLATKAELRESQRNGSWKWEIKLTGLSMRQLERLSKQQLWDKADKDGSLEETSQTPAQTAGIEPPADVIAVGSSVRVLDWEGHDCDQSSGDIVKILKIEDGLYQIDRKNRYGIYTWLRPTSIALSEVPNTETPAQAAGIEPPSGWGKPKTEVAEELGEGDVCQVLGGRYEGQVGTVASFNRYFEYPVSLNLPGGHVKKFLLNEVKLVSKNEASQSRQGLHSGQVLLGGKVATTGNYTGLRRENAIVNARNGLENKLAAMQLVKSGVSPEEAMAAVTGSTTASDDYDF